MDDIATKIAVIGAAGILAQWLAWRLHLPAITLLLAAGFILGPATGYLNPVVDFGDLYRPIISLSVAVILFEGGLTLNLKEISSTPKAVRRIILVAGPLVWIFAALAAHYVGALSWPTSIVLGAILVVTGPTVIMPLLRQAHLKSTPASILRWEAIVNDPIGALFAVLAFEVTLIVYNDHNAGNFIWHAISGIALAAFLGFATAKIIQWAFVRGHVAEFLKAPTLLAIVLALSAFCNSILEESGLLSVTIMGAMLANTRIASLSEMRRFKETITVLLVTGIFIVLTASLKIEMLNDLNWNVGAFVLLLVFVIRPLAVFIATIGSETTFKERLFIGWIGPRGVVAVAVTGVFAGALHDAGIEDAQSMIVFTFAVVVATIILHGFSLSPLAGLLDLKAQNKPGILIVGGSLWSRDLALKLQEMDIPVKIADRNWSHLSEARQVGIPVYFGEVLSEEAHLDIEPKQYSKLIAMTNNDDYNALICTDFGPELGRSNVFQLSGSGNHESRQTRAFTLGGREFTPSKFTYSDFRRNHYNAWEFQATTITQEYSYDTYKEARLENCEILLWLKPSGQIVMNNQPTDKPSAGDKILSYAKKSTNL